jgi:hypothetical protein
VWPAQAGQRRGNVCVTVDKPAIIVAKPNESAQLNVGSWDRPVPHRRNLARIDCHPGRRDPMAKEPKLAAPKLAFRGLDVELLLTEDGQDFANVLKMLFEGRAVTEEIVHIDHNRAVKWAM